MVTLALDQALKTSGCAVFENGKLKEYFTFTIPAHKSMEERLALFFKELTSLHNKYQFDELVLEDIQLQRNTVTFKHLAYVQSIVLLWCYYNQINYYIYSPSEWRKILGGKFGRKRTEQKEHAIELVEKKYKVTVDSDSADAICIGCAHLRKKDEQTVGFGQKI